MITVLEHTDPLVAEEIYELFQVSYQIEADMVGTDNFPPLQRRSIAIQKSENKFYGLRIENELAGVIELAIENEELHICSLVVSPNHFRKGVGKSLIEFAFELHPTRKSLVETAAVNEPAISLYERMGFEEDLTYMTSVGILKIRMRRS